MLARIALRMAAIEAIRGKTLVDDNVLDSEITALDADAAGNLKTDQHRPFVMVFTEGGNSEHAIGPRALYEAGSVELIIEIAVAATMAVRNETGDKEVIPGIPATDANFEFQLDIIGRQIVDALNDLDNEWAEIFRCLCNRIGKVERARTSSSEGTRIAAHQIKMQVDLIEDPLRGDPLEDGTPFAEFLAKLEASGDEPTLLKAAAMRAQITGTNEPWEAVRRKLGLTLDELLALGLGPFAVNADGSVPTFNVGIIEVEGTGTTVTVEP